MRNILHTTYTFWESAFSSYLNRITFKEHELTISFNFQHFPISVIITIFWVKFGRIFKKNNFKTHSRPIRNVCAQQRADALGSMDELRQCYMMFYLVVLPPHGHPPYSELLFSEHLPKPPVQHSVQQYCFLSEFEQTTINDAIWCAVCAHCFL